MSRKPVPHLGPIFDVDDATSERSKQQLLSPRPCSCTFARRLLAAGRASDAMKILDADIEAGNDNADFQFLLGRAAFRMGDHARAHRAFSRVVALAPQNTEAYRWLARLLFRPGDALTTREAMQPAPSEDDE